jgi:hypothetical protein
MNNSKISLLLPKKIVFSRMFASHASTAQKLDITRQPFRCILEQEHKNFNQKTNKSNFLILQTIISLYIDQYRR